MKHNELFPQFLIEGTVRTIQEISDPQIPSMNCQISGDTIQIICHPRFPRHHYYRNAVKEIRKVLIRSAKATILDRVHKASIKVQKHPQNVFIKFYKSRWGSCTNNGVLQMNWSLIMAPVFIIDYVAIHELCHLTHMNHSPHFWQEVKQHAPDYPESRRWLKQNASMILSLANWLNDESRSA
jgi:hypothetical protein